MSECARVNNYWTTIKDNDKKNCKWKEKKGKKLGIDQNLTDRENKSCVFFEEVNDYLMPISDRKLSVSVCVSVSVSVQK